jgi:hypothetical protein
VRNASCLEVAGTATFCHSERSEESLCLAVAGTATFKKIFSPPFHGGLPASGPLKILPRNLVIECLSPCLVFPLSRHLSIPFIY